MTPILSTRAWTTARRLGQWLASRRGCSTLALALPLLAAGISCDGSSITDAMADSVPPTVDLTAVPDAPDSVLAFNVGVADNFGILSVQVQVVGSGAATVLDTVLATTFTSNNTSINLPYALPVPTSVPLGTTVTIIASALDGMRNPSNVDTLFLGTGNVEPALVQIIYPTPTDTQSLAVPNVDVQIRGSSPNKVVSLGYVASDVFDSTVVDSVVFPADSLRDSIVTVIPLDLSSATTGTLKLVPFVVDSIGMRQTGDAVLVPVTATVPANTVPTVTVTVNDRIEATDTVYVHGEDRGGIQSLSYRIRPLATSSCLATTVEGSVSFATVAVAKDAGFALALDDSVVTAYPCQVEVTGGATNQAGTAAESTPDTVTLVAGVTRALPNGGVIADALFHNPTGNLYLTNIERNQLEVFNLASLTFEDPIQVGSRPWGLAVWPRDTTGKQGDTLLVANSGGTNISFVSAGTGLEESRYQLPNFGVYTVTTVRSKETGDPMSQTTQHEFSDRPQYLAVTCQDNGGGPCSDVILVYSTTPTPTQTAPFANRGSIRWENLTGTTTKSHFFFEQAMNQPTGRSDTLAVVRFPGDGVGAPDTLVKVSQGIVVDIAALAFRDTTFVRNSGDFQRVVIGEGGAAQGSRVMYYDAKQGFNPVTGVDDGISSAADVSDVIANTATNVEGVSINHDGELAAIRGDSTYLINPALRLQGMLQTSRGGAGFDFHPLNTQSGFGAADSVRVAFAASPQPELEVYDTYTYRKLCSIPIRDPIIGPIKAAMRGTGSDTRVVIVGATARGVVVVSLPSNITTFSACSP